MSDPRRWLVYSCAFVGTLASNAVLALIPELQGFFDASAAEVLLSITFYMLFFAVFSLFTGSISDQLGRRRILLIGLFVYGLGCGLTAISADLTIFYLSRAVQGLGFAFVQPLLMAVLGDIVPSKDMGKVMGWLTAATTAGITMGPLVAGYVSAIDWRLAFATIASISVILALLLIAFVDLPKIKGRSQSSGKLRKNISTVLKSRGVQMLAITGFLHVLVWIGTQAFTSDRLGEAPYLASAGQIGEVLAIAGFSSFVASRFGGGLADRIGRFWTVLTGNLVMVVSLVIMASISLGYVEYTLLLAIFAMGSAISWAAQLTLAVELMPSLKGSVSSFFTSAGFTGGALSPMLLSPLQEKFGVQFVYFVGAALCCVMCISIFYVDRNNKSKSLPN